MIIDPAKGMRGNFGACQADFKLGFLRLLNPQRQNRERGDGNAGLV